jgi:hypothetical protein
MTTATMTVRCTVAAVAISALLGGASTVSASSSAPAARADSRAATAANPYRGWLGGFEGSERVHRAGQGGYHSLNFRATPARRVRYRVCLRGGVLDAKRCYRRRTNTRGRSSINVSIFVNDRGGPGRWRAVWRVRGDRVAVWRFYVSPEGV